MIKTDKTIRRVSICKYMFVGLKYFSWLSAVYLKSPSGTTNKHTIGGRGMCPSR